MTIKVKLEDFIRYQKENGTYYLDKKNKYRIWASSKSRVINGFKKVNELYDGIYTEYNFSPESTNDNMCVTFYTKSKNKYRFDLQKEPHTNIYHLMFTLDDRTKDNYESVTNLDESKEVLGRLSYILKDVSKKYNITNFCIGATGDVKKDEIYRYMMLYVKSWEKRNTDEYDLGWALYFTI